MKLLKKAEFCHIWNLKDIYEREVNINPNIIIIKGNTSSFVRKWTPERPLPEIGKIVIENWCYLPGVYTFQNEAEIQEILSNKLWKSQFSIEILIKNILKICSIYRNFSYKTGIFRAENFEILKKLIHFQNLTFATIIRASPPDALRVGALLSLSGLGFPRNKSWLPRATHRV